MRNEKRDTYKNDRKKKRSLTNTYEAYSGKLALLHTYMERNLDSTDYVRELENRIRLMKVRLLNKGGDDESISFRVTHETD